MNSQLHFVWTSVCVWVGEYYGSVREQVCECNCVCTCVHGWVIMLMRARVCIIVRMLLCVCMCAHTRVYIMSTYCVIGD